MRRYSEAVKADVRRRMGPPHRQSMAEISQELGIHVITLYKWRKAWRLQGEVVPASQKDPEGWGLFPEQVARWRQAAQDANAQPLLTMADQKDLQKRHLEDQREIKRLQQELRRKDKALAEAAALLIASKKIQAYWGEDEGD